ncbi:DNA-binding protein [Arthrobacter globiformis]|nr:DNA-binding protein [Arthrobacter globiformis]
MSTPESASAPERRAAVAAEALAAEGLPVTSRAVRARAGVSMAVATEAATTWNEREAAQAHIPEAPESVTARFSGIWREAYSAARDLFASERETLTGRLRVVEEDNRSLTADLTTSDGRVAELEAELERVRTDAEQAAASAAAAHAAELSAERSRGDRAEGALGAVTTERDRLLRQIEAARPPAAG